LNYRSRVEIRKPPRSVNVQELSTHQGDSQRKGLYG
jgi:hypothetical protein